MGLFEWSPLLNNRRLATGPFESSVTFPAYTFFFSVEREYQTAHLDHYSNSMCLIVSLTSNQFQSELSKARRRRNAMLQIHLLPTEIFTTIVIQVMGELYTALDTVSQQRSYRRRRSMLQSICHLWKTAIRSTACLWACVSSKSPSKINNRSLRLSFKHPLICEDESDRGYVSIERADQFWQSVRPHAERFGTINATASNLLLDILGDGLRCLE